MFFNEKSLVILGIGFLGSSSYFFGHNYCPRCEMKLSEGRQHSSSMIENESTSQQHLNLTQCTCGRFFPSENEEIYCPLCRSDQNLHPECWIQCEKCGGYFCLSIRAVVKTDKSIADSQKLKKTHKSKHKTNLRVSSCDSILCGNKNKYSISKKDYSDLSSVCDDITDPNDPNYIPEEEEEDEGF